MRDLKILRILEGIPNGRPLGDARRLDRVGDHQDDIIGKDNVQHLRSVPIVLLSEGGFDGVEDRIVRAQ